MKNTFFTFYFLFALQGFAQVSMPTVFEKSGGTATGTYDEVINYYSALADTFPTIEMREMGETDSGHPLHLVILDPERDFDLEKSRKKEKVIILINNGIHPGEPDGIEASQMLLRNYASDTTKRHLLENIVIAVIPVYNIGGALNRSAFSRANQNGPESYGFRGNARNYDLNRDFIKADTKNAKSFFEIFHQAQPDIFIDTHVSNGADYQYAITHLATQHNKMGGAMGSYIHKTFIPKLEKIIAGKGSEIIPYVNVFSGTPDESGIRQFMDHPRYSTGYTTLFNTLGMMIETHMLKPFDERVRATYHFFESVLEIAAEDGDHIRMAHQAGILPDYGDLYPIAWQLDTTKLEQIMFKGYEGKMIESKVTGQSRLLYDRDEPFSKSIPYYNTYQPAKEVTMPFAYIIPQGWHEVIDRLKWNQLEYRRMDYDTTIQVEAYRIKSYTTSSSAYEGHYPHSNVEVVKEKRPVQFRKGDYIFMTQQAGMRYLMETLEPEATDSFFKWNFFDPILQQKEHFSPYVFEEVARQLLEDDPELKEAFEQKKKEDPKFAKNWYAQLDYIYKRSPYYENAHLEYPVYRWVR